MRTGDCSTLREFIENQIANLCDPYEGEPLSEDWEAMLETLDAHQYGDFALTTYYDPLEDVGLGYDWERSEHILSTLAEESKFPILGFTIGPDGEPFDPGKMGTYFQSEALVVENLRAIEKAFELDTSSVALPLRILRLAATAGKGLYVTF